MAGIEGQVAVSPSAEEGFFHAPLPRAGSYRHRLQTTSGDFRADFEIDVGHSVCSSVGRSCTSCLGCTPTGCEWQERRAASLSPCVSPRREATDAGARRRVIWSIPSRRRAGSRGYRGRSVRAPPSSVLRYVLVHNSARSE